MSVDSLLRLAPIVLVLPWALSALLVERSRVKEGRSPILIPLLVLVLPFYSLAIPDHRFELLMQASAVLAVAYYVNLMKRSAVRAAFARVRPILIPATVFAGFVGLSYVLSPRLARADVYSVFNLITGVAYIALAGIYCRSLRDFERLIRFLILAAVLQLPVVVAQAMGWASALPGGLSALDPAEYGGALADSLGVSSAVVRYPGSFGDYELLAEFCGMMLVVCIGMLMFNLTGRSRPTMILAAIAISVTGWFTGTRSFVIVALGGLLVLSAFALLQGGHRFTRLGRLAAILGFVAGAALLIIPDSLRRGFIERISTTSFTGTYAFNRAELFTAWLDLAKRMPWQGYGPRMPEMLPVAYRGFDGNWPHSLYFTALLTSGIMGLLTLIWMMATFVYLAVSTALAKVPTRHAQWGAVMAAAALYLVANEAKIEMVRLVFYVDIVFLLFGMVSSLHALALEDRREIAYGAGANAEPGEVSPSLPAVPNHGRSQP